MLILLLVLILAQKCINMDWKNFAIIRQTCHYAQFEGFYMLIHHAKAQSQ